MFCVGCHRFQEQWEWMFFSIFMYTSNPHIYTHSHQRADLSLMLSASDQLHCSRWGSGVLNDGTFVADVSSATFSSPAVDFDHRCASSNSRLVGFIKGLLYHLLSEVEKWARLPFMKRTLQARLLLSTLLGIESVLTRYTLRACYLGENTMIYCGKQKLSTPWCQDGSPYFLCFLFLFMFQQAQIHN